MLRKIFGSLLVIFLLVTFAATAFALVKGLENDKQSIVRVGDSVVVPQGAEVKSAVSVGGSVTVYGKVAEDVVSVGGSVFLKDTATVGGDVVSVGGKVMKEPGAISKGDIVEVSVAGITPAVSFFTKGGMLKGLAFFGLLNFIGFLILAIILVALFTPQLGRTSSSMEGNLLRDCLIGLLIAVLIIPVAIILAVSIVGIILIPVWIVLVIGAGLFGYIAIGHLLGKKTLQAFRIHGKSMMVETLCGIVLLSLIGLVPVGGFIIKMIAWLCGLGAVYMTRFGTK
ncbi:MAG: hypothetical protein MUC35_03155 [Candidatus Margulisbacteria bacterium]|jgi:hypothetical protein|nr:hypothetical protein [Candidatus Margulisiibacteriota bacterium]